MSDEYVESLISSNGMKLVAEPADANPYMLHPSWDMSHWRCVLSANDAENLIVVVSMGPDYEGRPPTLDHVIEVVLEDVGLYRSCNGYQDFVALLGIEDDGRAVEAWDELGRIHESLSALVERQSALEPAI